MASRKKRKKKRSSRLPALLLIVAMAGVGGLLVVSAQNSPADDADTDPPPADTAPAEVAADTTVVAEATAPNVTIGSVAPPVSIDNGSDDDGDEGLVLDDFTPADTPAAPATPDTVPAGSVTNGRIRGSLADGYYLGYLDGIGSETSIVVRLDSSTGPEYDAPLDELLFVSLRVDARDPSHPGSAVVAARTLHQLLAQGDATYTIPDTDDLVIVEGTYLLTVSDGRLVGIEAIS